MVNFYKDEAGVVMFKDDTYLETDKFVIERPATHDDAVENPGEHAAFVAAIAPVQPEPIPEPEPAPTVSPDGVA
jgi:hypothetical protein